MPDEELKRMVGPITIEQAFNVDGKRLLVKVTFPAAIAADIGMEQMYQCANRALVHLESKTHHIEKPR